MSDKANGAMQRMIQGLYEHEYIDEGTRQELLKKLSNGDEAALYKVRDYLIKIANEVKDG